MYDYWNPDNMMYRSSEEFKYLDQIQNLIIISKRITDLLTQIYDNEHFNIQKGGVKSDYEDYTEQFCGIAVDMYRIEKKINEL